MKIKIKEKPLYKKEEIGNSITHGIGILLSIVGLILLVVKGVKSHDPTKLFSFTLFGITLVILYTASTLYHALYINTKSNSIKYLLRLIDHGAIYLLIAGTYTPFSLVAIKGALGRNIAITIWIIALLGILLKVFFVGRFPIVFTTTYLVMGYLILFAWKVVVKNIPHEALILLIAGGLTYSLGVIFYALQKFRYNHFIWHFFVLFGSILHYLAVLLYL